MKIRSLRPKAVRFHTRLSQIDLPARWPLSVAGQISWRAGKLSFDGRMTARQQDDLLLAGSSPKFHRAIKNLYARAERDTRWSLKDWLASGEYEDQWANKYRSRTDRNLAVLRRRDGKGFVVLCPTFLKRPMHVEVCRYGDVHAVSKVRCRFCQCPVEVGTGSKVNFRLRVCNPCWVTALALLGELDSAINTSVRQRALKLFGKW